MLCSRCHKRQAVVFVSNNSKDAPTVGYCLTCAKELGIKPVEDLINKMGISDDDLENVQDQMIPLCRIWVTTPTFLSLWNSSAPIIWLNRWTILIQMTVRMIFHTELRLFRVFQQYVRRLKAGS